MATSSQYIKEVIDKSLRFSGEILLGLQEPKYFVPDYMIDHSKTSPYDEIVYWKPVAVGSNDKQIQDYEKNIGFQLPVTYKSFLSYKYFISLNFGHNAQFFRHTSTWVDDYTNIIYPAWVDILHEGLIPFAKDMDSGFFCFDTTKIFEGKEYYIVTYDREYGKQEYPSKVNQFTFIDLVHELEKKLDDWKAEKQRCA